MVDVRPRKDFAERIKRWLASALLLACSRPPNGTEPRLETSGGAGLPLAAARQDAGRSLVREPLLLDPAFAEVRQALEVGDSELAAVAARSTIDQLVERNANCPACSYLLGVLEERAGSNNRAIVAFENAAQTSWELQQDAWLHLLRLELGKGSCARARELIQQPWGEQLAVAARGALTVEVELCERRWAAAIEHLRQLIAGSSDGTHRPQHQVKLAEILLNEVSAEPSRKAENVAEAKQLLDAALGQGINNVELLERSRAMLERILTDFRGTNEESRWFSERVSLVEGFVEARRFTEARRLALELAGQSGGAPPREPSGCRLSFASGRIAAGLGERSAAIEAFERVSENCSDSDLAARALFLRGGQLAALGKRLDAISAYEQLERRYSTHRLADDARLKQALLHRAAGSESRFVALLGSMPDDYPDGDMLLEGLFQLGLRSMAQNNWAAALSVLERAERMSTSARQTKEIDVDRQRYFLARANIELGRAEVGVQLLTTLVTERPLTYYMLLAYSALSRLRPESATGAMTQGLRHSASEPLALDTGNEVERRQVERLLALLGVGDLDAADELLDDPATQRLGERSVFAIAGRYANAGAPKTALALVKRNGRDWRVRWPTSGWLDLWQQAFPRPYRAMVSRESKRSGIDEALIYAIMREESEFDPRAVSQADAYGLMQVIVPTAQTAGRELGIPVDSKALQRPGVNIAIGSRVLAKLAERFSGQLALIAAGYNAGPGRAQRWLRTYPEVGLDIWVELVEYPETRAYVKRVLESHAAYRWLYETADGGASSLEILPPRLKAASNG